MGTATAWQTYGKLSTDEPDVTVDQRIAYFGDVKPREIATSQVPHFQITLAASVPCGKDLRLVLQLSAANIDETITYIHPLRELPPVDMIASAEDIIMYGPDYDDNVGSSVSAGDGTPSPSASTNKKSVL